MSTPPERGFSAQAAAPPDASAFRRAAGSERLVLRIGAVCAVLGPLTGLIVNILHPRVSATTGIAGAEEYLREVAGSSIWVPVHVGLTIAAVLYLAALVALSRSLSEEKGAGLARLGLALAVATTGVNLVQLPVDGIAVHDAAETWDAATGAEKVSALHAGAALVNLDFALLSSTVVFFFGFTYILYALAVSVSDRYPRRWGWVGLVGGGGALVTGLLQMLTGPSFATLYVFPAFVALLGFWLLVIGVLLWRQTRGTGTV